MKHVAPLRYGVIFKKAFGDPEIFTAFVRDFIGVDIEISKVETEKSFHPPIGPVDAHFDLFAEDSKNRIVVDIQHDRLTDHYDRFLYYHCAAMLELTAHTKTYRPDIKVYTLVVLTSGDRHHADIAVIDFDPKDLHGRPLKEIAHKIIYICPKYVSEETPGVCQEWLRAIDDTLDEQVDETQYKNPVIHKVFNCIEESQVTPQERAKMKDEAARKETIDEKAKEIACKMLRRGRSVEEIVEDTGLTQEQVNELL
ncbi:PD-(D/E)XK nuclease family transposase [Candidatus Electronema sp. PJ]|uniref:PD-(D/E)XK nuclease family transposase n=1 Tax=Candidatus Electronema sp. PJ TaxID=3401572 RepID=UPI003AA7CD1E